MSQSLSQIYDYAIIGCGLMGSAATKYIADSVQYTGKTVIAVGQAEPPNTRTHTGVFASHYDQGRLTYQLSNDAVWTYLGREAIAQYANIERRSGIRFHGAVGRVSAVPKSALDSLAYRFETAMRENIPYFRYDAGGEIWKINFPFLDFPDDFVVLHEPAPAGYVNPRQLVAAQLTVAEQAGTRLVRDVVVGVDDGADGVQMRLQGMNEPVVAKQVLVASGAFTNFNALLPRPIPLKIKTETIVLGKVSAEVAQRLTAMPIVTYTVDDPDIADIYMAPPLQYPDGDFYIKMGANTRADMWPETLAEINEWFHHGDSDACKPALADALRSMLPDVKFDETVSRRCIVCYTPSRVPTIDWVDDTQRFLVVTGGNGAGAKGSDTIGRLAAGVMVDGTWPDELDREPFRLGGNQ
ncbi:MAG: FAD-binding oxidoreductase [Chloroflexota bacterium]